MSSIICSMRGISLEGISPFSTSFPIRLHSMRRKYSWRAYDTNDRLSVSIPTNLDNSPSMLNTHIGRKHRRHVFKQHHPTLLAHLDGLERVYLRIDNCLFLFQVANLRKERTFAFDFRLDTSHLVFQVHQRIVNLHFRE